MLGKPYREVLPKGKQDATGASWNRISTKASTYHHCGLAPARVVKSLANVEYCVFVIVVEVHCRICQQMVEKQSVDRN